jgi:hypothetical protein
MLSDKECQNTPKRTAAIDLTFYPLRTSSTVWRTFPIEPETWIWQPNWPTFPNNMAASEDLTSAGWVKVGTYRDGNLALWTLSSQLSDIRLLEAKNEQGQMESHVWVPVDDKKRVEELPVLLAFTLSPEQRKRPGIIAGEKIKALVTPCALPPANLGEIGLVLTLAGDKLACKRYRIGELGRRSQHVQQRMVAALSHLGSAHLERSAWLVQWKDIQALAQQLAADYWRAHRDKHVERPQPINIWTLRQGEGALAAMTMVQAGAYAGINNKDKWEQAHMIHQGPHQGLMAPRYLYHAKHTEAEYWMQHPEEAKTPVDTDLASQEVLRHLRALSDWEADIVTLAPIYLLAKGEDEVYLSPEQLLRDVDIQPKQNRAGYGNGYRPEELQRVIDAFERMAWMQLKIRQSIMRRRGVKPALITAEAPYLVITERIYQEPLEETGPRKFLGWKYQLTWLKHFTGDTEAGKQLGILLKKSFTYSQNQRWEKRLARYLTIQLCVAAHHGQLGKNFKMREVLEQCGLAPTERDKARPGEYVRQFEHALDHLKRDGIIGDWMPTIDRHAPGFPTRDWLGLWLDSSFHVTQASIALAGGYQKMIDTRKPQKEPDGVLKRSSEAR